MGKWITDTVINLQLRGILRVEDGNHGEYRPRSDEFVDAGVAFIRAADMANGMVLFDSASKINEAARERITKGIGKPGDILISHKGTVGRIARAAVDAPEFVCSPQTTFWRSTNEEILSQDFLYVYMRSPKFMQEFLVRSGETDMAGYVSLTSQRCLTLTIPPIELQHPTSSLISALDDKIELNRRMNGTLEAAARAIFKDWFVDFGPTRAKMEGRAPYLAPDIWSLFPDSLGHSGNPDGWRTSTVGAEFKLTMGQSPPGDTYNEAGDGLPFFQGRTDFGFRYPVRRKYCSAPNRVARADDTLVSVRAPVGDLNMAWEECCIGRGVAAIRHNSGGRGFTYYCIQSLQPEIERFEDTGSVFGAINKVQFERLKCIDPGSPVTEAFEATVQGLDDRIRANVSESEALVTTRDFLLPKLMSGEVRVSGAENLVAEAT